MITGKRAFEASSPASVIAAILERQAPALEPAGLNRVVQACLAKDPDERIQTARDLRRAIEWGVPGVESAAAAPRRSKSWIAWAAVTGVCAALAAIGWLRPQPEPGPRQSVAFTILPPKGSSLIPVGSLATPEISPDGSSIVYAVDPRMLHFRRLNSLQPEPLRGTEGVSSEWFWSPDSRSVAFPAGRELKKMRVPDGAPEVIARLSGPTRSGTWGSNGTILFASIGSGNFGLYAVSAAGGEAIRIDVPGLQDGSYYRPEFLPDGEDFLFAFLRQGSEEMEIYLATLHEGKPSTPVLLRKNESAARYTPAGGGHLLFVRNDSLYAQKLDLKRRRLEGEPEMLKQGVASAPAVAIPYFSVSNSGLLAWRPGKATLYQLTLFDRQGKQTGTAGPPGPMLFVRLSPDQKRLLAGNTHSAWLLEPNQPGRLSVAALGESSWTWSPDGLRLLTARRSRVVERPMSGVGDVRELADASHLDSVKDVSPDGKVLLYNAGGSLFSVALDGPAEERAPKPVVQTGELIYNPGFSPDGRWIVYRTTTVQNQNTAIYIQPFPGPGLRKQISNGGNYPVWRRDGKEIVYFDQDRIWSVRVDVAGGELRASAPQPLFSVRQSPGLVTGLNPLAITRDGSQIFFPQTIEQPDSGVIDVACSTGILACVLGPSYRRKIQRLTDVLS